MSDKDIDWNLRKMFIPRLETIRYGDLATGLKLPPQVSIEMTATNAQDRSPV